MHFFAQLEGGEGYRQIQAIFWKDICGAQGQSQNGLRTQKEHRC